MAFMDQPTHSKEVSVLEKVMKVKPSVVTMWFEVLLQLYGY